MSVLSFFFYGYHRPAELFSSEEFIVGQLARPLSVGYRPVRFDLTQSPKSASLKMLLVPLLSCLELGFLYLHIYYVLVMSLQQKNVSEVIPLQMYSAPPNSCNIFSNWLRRASNIMAQRKTEP